jgi:MFS family permease
MIKIAIFLFTFMTAVDVTVAATIMPQIIRDLGDMNFYPFVGSAYLIAYFITAPIFGKVCDYFGCKKPALLAILLFLVGSLFCGLAHSMKELCLARFIQGAGACGLVNICSILIGQIHAQDQKRSYLQAILSAIWALAGIIGPTVAGFLVLFFSWRSVFMFNVPIALFTIFILARFQEEKKVSLEKFDFTSLFLFIASVLLFFLAFAKVVLQGLFVYKFLFGALGCTVLALFIKRSLRVPSPLIPIRLVFEPHIAVCILFGVVSGLCITTAHSLISLYIQGALRLSMQAAGGAIMATSIGWAIGSFTCSHLLKRLDLRLVFLVATCALVLGFSLLGFGPPKQALAFFVMCNSILGFGLGAIVNATIVGVQKVKTPSYLGRATSFLSLMRSLGTSTGAFMAGLLQLFYFRSSLQTTTALSQEVRECLIEAPEKFLNKDVVSTLLPQDFSILCDLFASSIQEVFFVPCMLLLLIAPLAWKLKTAEETVVV